MPQTTANDLPLSALCYLDASKVDSPAGALSGLGLVTAEGNPIGTIVGVVIEPAARRVRYYDVRATGWRRRHYLVKADQLAQVDSENGVLRLVGADFPEVGDFDAEELHRFSDFSDANLQTAVVSSRGA